MRKYIRIGVDIAKNSFQVHALESEDCSATKRKLSRSGIVKFLAEVEPCTIGMEACGSAHYWARRFGAMGHEVKLTPPIYVKAYVKRGKNDAADAAAICEAMSRPNMRFVAVKSEDQQATLMAHKTRELLIKQRTMSMNALRGHLAEFGVVAAKGTSHIEELVERAAADLPAMVQATLGVLLAQLRSLDAAVDAGRPQSAQTGQGRGRSVGQQARPDCLGHHHHRRSLPQFHLCQGLIPSRAKQSKAERRLKSLASATTT